MKTMEHGYLIGSTSIRPSGAMFTGKSLKALLSFFSSISESVFPTTPFAILAASNYFYLSNLAYLSSSAFLI